MHAEYICFSFLGGRGGLIWLHSLARLKPVTWLTAPTEYSQVVKSCRLTAPPIIDWRISRASRACQPRGEGQIQKTESTTIVLASAYLSTAASSVVPPARAPLQYSRSRAREAGDKRMRTQHYVCTEPRVIPSVTFVVHVHRSQTTKNTQHEFVLRFTNRTHY